MRTITKGALGVLLVVFVVGCAGTREYVVQGQTPAAGADAEVTVERQDETENWTVEVNVEHLLPPGRFADALTVYAVWLRAADDQPERVGALDYDGDDRVGELTVTTSLPSFELLITGESSPTAVTPSEHVVLRTNVEPE